MQTQLAGTIGKAIQKAASERRGWYGPHMAAATRALSQRIPLVDILLELRDARIPLSSEYELLRNYPSARRIIVLNKVDLANRAATKEWIRYFDQRNCISYGINSHNKDNVKEFLNFLHAQVRGLKKIGHSSHTTTIMLLGIPNVGKSALANSLHQIGRVSATEKGKLCHSIVSPQPGETQNIGSLKIGSNPNIYVLDTPGILPPQINDIEVCSKLALTGALSDSLVGEKEIAQYFLSIINSSDEYKKWVQLISSQETNKMSLSNCNLGSSSDPIPETQKRKRYATDHTQDFMVHNVRRALFNLISSFEGDLENEKDSTRLIETELISLREALRVLEEDNDPHLKVATKLINLCRTGRLGHYSLDKVGTNS
ncbi:hypothetical protein ACFE04_008754 [Oxalis oulophora]